MLPGGKIDGVRMFAVPSWFGLKADWRGFYARFDRGSMHLTIEG